MQRLRNLTLALFAVLALVAAGCDVNDDPDEAEDPPADEEDEPVEEDTEPPEDEDAVDDEEDAAERVRTAAENTEEAETAELLLALQENDDLEGTNDDVEADDDADVGDDAETGQDASEVRMEGAVDFAQDFVALQTVDNDLVILIDGEQAYVRVPSDAAVDDPGTGDADATDDDVTDDAAATDDDATDDDVTDDVDDQYTWVEVDLDELRDVDALGGPGGVAFQSPQDAITELQNVEQATEVDDDNGVTEDDDNGVNNDEATDTAGLTRYEVTIEREDATNGALDDDNGVNDEDDDVLNDDDNGLDDDDEGVIDDDENGVNDEDDDVINDDDAPADDSGVQEITADVWIDDDEELVHAVRYHLEDAAVQDPGDNDVGEDDDGVLDDDDNGVNDEDEDVLNDDDNGLDDDDEGVIDDDENDVADDTTNGAQFQYLTIEFQEHGVTVDIDGPDADEVEDVDTEQLRELFRQPQQWQSGSGADAPTNDDNDDDL